MRYLVQTPWGIWIGGEAERKEPVPYMCGLCGEAEAATFLITPLSGADTMAVGQECAPVALTGMLASYMGMDADKLYDKLTAAASDSATEGESIPAPDGYLYKTGTGDLHSITDIDQGLCGYLWPDGQHCHRKLSHTGRHAKAAPSEGEPPPPPAAAPPAAAAAGQGEQ